MIKLSKEEKSEIIGGELTIAAVMAAMGAAIAAVIIYRLFVSDKGGATIPGGFKFSWS